jgi:hypothetical protein
LELLIKPSTNWLIASGWSPVGLYSDLNLNKIIKSQIYNNYHLTR